MARAIGAARCSARPSSSYRQPGGYARNDLLAFDPVPATFNCVGSSCVLAQEQGTVMASTPAPTVLPPAQSDTTMASETGAKVVAAAAVRRTGVKGVAVQPLFEGQPADQCQWRVHQGVGDHRSQHGAERTVLSGACLCDGSASGWWRHSGRHQAQVDAQCASTARC